jgi:hypothetical protein
MLREAFRRQPAVREDDGINPLAEFFFERRHSYAQKWADYFDIYHRHFGRFRGRSPVVLEIGVKQGGSLEMWREYFGAGCRIYGVDIDARCAACAGEGISVLIGDQADRIFLARLRRELPRIDVLIDDGSHHVADQMVTFEELFPHLSETGLYLCEDVHTSYWEKYGGGLAKPGTFIEFSKALVDRLNAWHWQDIERASADQFARGAWSIAFYRSVVVVEKRPMAPPRDCKRGESRFGDDAASGS